MHVRAALTACALLCFTGPVFAQQVTVSASVPVTSPTGAGVRNLAFGAAAPLAGQTVEIDVPAAALPLGAGLHSGEFRYDVSSTRGLEFTLSLPGSLAGPGSALLPVTFAGNRYGGYCVTAGGSACTLTAFDPAAGATIRVCYQEVGGGSCHPGRVFPTGSELAVHVGGRLSIPSSALAGAYTATVTLTIVQVY